MRAWQDTEMKRRWAATPSRPPGGGSRAASLTGAVDMGWQDDGNRSGNLSGNPKGVRTDRFAKSEMGGETKSGLRWGAVGNRRLGWDLPGKGDHWSAQRWGRGQSSPWSDWIAWQSGPPSVL